MYQIFQECSKHSIKCTKCTITFQTTFFLKQNYRLTIIHSQTLQLSCNSFKFIQTFTRILLSISRLYLSISTTDISTVKTPQFSPYNSSLKSISPLNTTLKTLHNCPKTALPIQNVSTYVFLLIFPVKKRNQHSNFSFHAINSITINNIT